MTETLPLWTQGIAEWMPFAKAAGFFLAACTLEDVAAIGAGLLLATGDISWPTAFAACFFGIWVGDTSIYSLARYGGRKWFERSSLGRFGPGVARSERWFGERGTIILVFSRMVPAARFPTYLAAGFLRVPWPKFLLVTGIASCLWTLIVLSLAQTLGVRLVHWLGAYKHASLLIILIGAALVAVLHLARRALMNFDSRRA